MCDFTSPSCGDSSSIADIVKRKTSTLTAINARVTTGQRRASMFSCLMGINIDYASASPENPTHSRQFNFGDMRFKDDAWLWPIFSNPPFPWESS
jgi:hypothetical protein